MCIICVSKSGIRQPDESTIRTMFHHNPHGAGYMFARGGRVIIHKGFMNPDDYLRAIREEHFTAADSVVYHFRISTQAGVNPEMSHPFPLSNQPGRLRSLDQSCRIGVAPVSYTHLSSWHNYTTVLQHAQEAKAAMTVRHVNARSPSFGRGSSCTMAASYSHPKTAPGRPGAGRCGPRPWPA